MAKQTINIGTTANDGTGDPLRTAFGKVNDNFDELYSSVRNTVNQIVVPITSDPLVNGESLRSAYSEAKLLTPNGQALSATNRACVIVPPGRYNMGQNASVLVLSGFPLSVVNGNYYPTSPLPGYNHGDWYLHENGNFGYISIDGESYVTDETFDEESTLYMDDGGGWVDANTFESVSPSFSVEQSYTPLTLDTEFVDIIGLTTDRSLQQIYGTPEAINSGVIVQTADDVHISNLYVKILTEVESVNWDNTDSAAYFPSTDLSNTVVDNCQFDGQDGNDFEGPRLFSMRMNIEYSGTFNNCTGGYGAFGGYGEASGTFNNCTGGYGAFGGYGEASGTFTNCTGGNGSFGGGAGTASGTFTNCTGGGGAFGGGAGTASGTFTSCTGGWGSFGGGAGTASGTFTSCTGGIDSFGGGAGTASGTFTSCTGGDYSFGAGGTASGTFTSCTGGDYSFGGDGTASGTFTFCKGGVDSFNNRTLAEGGKIYACVDDGGFIDES